MLSLNLTRIIQWLMAHAGLVAGVVTAAIALLLFCGIECCNCSKRDKDSLFNRRTV